MKNDFAPNCEQCRELYPQDFIGNQTPLYCLICVQRFLASKKHLEDP